MFYIGHCNADLQALSYRFPIPWIQDPCDIRAMSPGSHHDRDWKPSSCASIMYISACLLGLSGINLAPSWSHCLSPALLEVHVANVQESHARRSSMQCSGNGARIQNGKVLTVVLQEFDPDAWTYSCATGRIKLWSILRGKRRDACQRLRILVWHIVRLRWRGNWCADNSMIGSGEQANDRPEDNAMPMSCLGCGMDETEFIWHKSKTWPIDSVWLQEGSHRDWLCVSLLRNINKKTSTTHQQLGVTRTPVPVRLWKGLLLLEL